MYFRCLSGSVKIEVGNRNLKFRERLRMDTDIGDLLVYVIIKYK